MSDRQKLGGGGANSRVDPGGAAHGSHGAASEAALFVAWRNAAVFCHVLGGAVAAPDVRFESAFLVEQDRVPVPWGSCGVNLAWRAKSVGGGDEFQQFVAGFVAVFSSGYERSSTAEQDSSKTTPRLKTSDRPSTRWPSPRACSRPQERAGRCGYANAAVAEILILEGEPEIRHAGFAGRVDQDLGGLDVPVDQPSSVGVMSRMIWVEGMAIDGGLGQVLLRSTKPGRDGRAWRGPRLQQGTPRCPPVESFAQGLAP